MIEPGQTSPEARAERLRFATCDAWTDMLRQILTAMQGNALELAFDAPPTAGMQLTLRILGFSPAADDLSHWELPKDPEGALDDVQPAVILSGLLAERALAGLAASATLRSSSPWTWSHRGILVHDDSVEGFAGRELLRSRASDRTRFVQVGTTEQADLAPQLVLPSERTRAAWRDVDDQPLRAALHHDVDLPAATLEWWREQVVPGTLEITVHRQGRRSPQTFAEIDVALIPHAGFLSDLDRAHVVATAASAGSLIIADRLERLQPYLAAEFLGIVEQIDIATAHQDPLYRDRMAVAIHREIARHHSPSAGTRRLAAAVGSPSLPPAAVSIVLATKRPWLVPRALSMIASQTYPDLEVVIAVHGHEVGQRVEGEWRQGCPHPLTVIEVHDAFEVGEVYTAAVKVAAGEIVAVWDDDDFYDIEHVFDLVDALNASGADLVGKAAEFVHLADLDLTIQRHRGGRDRDSRLLGGGTFCYPRTLLAEFGAALSSTVGEDRQLLHRIEAAGGRVYRTHGYGYVLFRGHAHTWVKEPEYFLAQASRQWDGFVGSEAGLDRRIGLEGFKDE